MATPTFDELYEVRKRLYPQVQKQLAEYRSRLVPDSPITLSVVHTYKGEGLTACGLEVVGPCPDCANRERA